MKELATQDQANNPEQGSGAKPTAPASEMIESISQQLESETTGGDTPSSTSATWAFEFQKEPKAQISVVVTVAGANNSDSRFSAVLSKDAVQQISGWLLQHSTALAKTPAHKDPKK